MDDDGTRSSSLHALLDAKRDELIARWSDSIGANVAPEAIPRGELLDRVPGFVDEIIAALYPGALPLPVASDHAFEHGAQRLRLGFDVAEVVREYGLLHDCVLQLADEEGLTVSARDQQVLAKWLNVGIADAIAEYVKVRDGELRQEASQHIGFLAHELRNPLSAGLLALQRLRRMDAAAGGGSGGQTVDILERNLRRMARMIDGALGHASTSMGVEPKLGRLAVRPFLGDIARDWEVEARARHIELVVSAPEHLTVEADERLLRSALSNLVHNALKFSHAYSRVALRAARADGRVAFEVEDACGGLPVGTAEELFAPSVQRGQDRSGFGFGLAIARQAIVAHHGTIRARDIPGTGCVFTIDLPAD